MVIEAQDLGWWFIALKVSMAEVQGECCGVLYSDA